MTAPSHCLNENCLEFLNWVINTAGCRCGLFYSLIPPYWRCSFNTDKDGSIAKSKNTEWVVEYYSADNTAYLVPFYGKMMTLDGFIQPSEIMRRIKLMAYI